MKHFVFSAGLLLAAASAHAQTTAGTFLLGGQLGYYRETREEISTSYHPANTTTIRQFNAIPSAAVFVTDNLAVGLRAGIYQNQNQRSDYYYPNGVQVPAYGLRTDQSTSFHVGPLVRYYHMVGEKIGFYGQLAGGYEWGRATTRFDVPNSSSARSRYTNGFADLLPGFVFFPTSRLGLELTLGGLHYFRGTTHFTDIGSTEDKQAKTSILQARVGLNQLLVGASFYLGGR